MLQAPVVRWHARSPRAPASGLDDRPLQPAAVPGERWEDKRILKSGNYVLPGSLDPSEIRLSCARLLIEAADDLRDAYREVAWHAFRVDLAPRDVIARLDLIEVAWDVHCPLAVYAPVALRPAWDCQFRTTDLHDGRWLDGGDRRGERYKLYPKAAPHLLRAEYVLEKQGLRRLAKRERVLSDGPALIALIDRLAARAFPRFLHVQADVCDDEMPRLADGLMALMPPHLRDVARDVFQSLYATQRFQNVGGSTRHRDYLRRLRRDDVVRHVGRGLYVATPTFARWLRHLFALERARGRVV